MINLFDLLFEGINEVIIEPKRKQPKDTSQLGIQFNQGDGDIGINNIKSVYNEATEEEKDFWGRWYHHAKQDVQELANTYEINFPVMAAVVAVLSPGNKWVANLLAAEKVVQKFKDPNLEIKINAYPKNVNKALKILETGNIGELNLLGFVTGPKVSVFFKSLLNPDTVGAGDEPNDLVLDSHAINIWRGIKRAIKQTEKPSIETRQKMVNDYKTVASELGITVQSLQAITWYIWKYTTNPPKIPDVTLPVEIKPKRKSRVIKKDVVATIPTELDNNQATGG